MTNIFRVLLAGRLPDNITYCFMFKGRCGCGIIPQFLVINFILINCLRIFYRIPNQCHFTVFHKSGMEVFNWSCNILEKGLNYLLEIEK